MSKPSLYQKARRIAGAMLRRYYSHLVGQDSAALTYYLLFSLFPLLIFLSNLVGIFAVDIRSFLYELHRVIPTEVLELMVQYLDYVSGDASRGLLTFSLIFTIYFPLRSANCLLRSVRKAYGLERPTNFLRHQFRVLVFTLCLLLAIPLSLLFLTVGNSVLDFVGRWIYISEGFIRLWTTLRFLLPGLIVFFALFVLYAIAQDRPEGRYIWPGVLFSFFGWTLLSLLFSLYVENVGRYNFIYGSIGAIIVLLLWLYLTAAMLILGAEFNAVLKDLQAS